MKKYFLKSMFITVLAMQTLALDEQIERGSSIANQALATDFIRNYSNIFNDSITRYNANRKNVNSILSMMKDEKSKVAFKKYLTDNKITELPEIYIKNDAAHIKAGDVKISFTVGSLFERTIYVDGKEVVLPKDNYENSLKSLKSQIFTEAKKTTFLDLLISNAYAGDVKKFEHLVFATAIILNNNFSESEWCISCADEYKAATRKNFEKIMGDIKKRAEKCESGEDTQDTFAMKMDDIVSYQSANYDLKEKMQDFFKSYSDPNLDCEKMVRSLYDDEIHKQTKAPGFYTGSVGKEREAENQRVYNDFVAKKCDPYMDLRTCLVNKTYSGKEVWGSTTGKSLRYREQIQNNNYEAKQGYKYNISK